MLYFVSRLNDRDFVNLLVAIKKMHYGDIKSCEYIDKDTYRKVHLWDNSRHFDDRKEDQYFTIDDFNISEKNALFNYYLFMLHQFGEEWYENAKTYLESEEKLQALEVLEQAKTAHEADLEADKEFFETLC
ncbi:MAG: hypothetical protein IJ310_03510 [Clostridia bacterium]|nr:hypothetical protein [Clostridia bacterium]